MTEGPRKRNAKHTCTERLVIMTLLRTRRIRAKIPMIEMRITSRDKCLFRGHQSRCDPTSELHAMFSSAVCYPHRRLSATVRLLETLSAKSFLIKYLVVRSEPRSRVDPVCQRWGHTVYGGLQFSI